MTETANKKFGLTLHMDAVAAPAHQAAHEIELYAGIAVEAGELIEMRMETRTLTFQVGDRLKLAPADFEEMAFACFQFGTALATRLPSVTPTA